MKRIVLLFALLAVLISSCAPTNKQIVAVAAGQKITSDELFRYIAPDQFAALGAKQKKEQINKICDDFLALKYLKDQGDLDTGNVFWEIRVWDTKELANGAYQNLVVDKLLTEQAMRSLYDKMKSEINVSHILISYKNKFNLSERDQNEAQALVDSLLAVVTPENFESLVLSYSDDRSKNDNHGNFGWVGAGYFVDNFEDAAYALKAGEISKPIETDFGYHIILLNDRRNIPIESYENLKFDIREMILNRWGTRFALREREVFDSLRVANPLNLNDSLVEDFVDRFNRLSVNVFYSKEFTSFNIMDIFDNTLVLGTLGKQAIDKDWIYLYLNMISQFQPPRFTDKNSFLKFINQNYMGALLYSAALDLGLDKSYTFITTRHVYLAQKSASLFDKLYVYDRINPSKTDLINFYEDKKDDLYSYEPRVQVCEVLVKDSTLAWDILRRVREGEDMGEMAEKYSIRNIGKKNRGMIPPVKKNQYGEMGLAAFNMLDGEVRGPFPVEDNYSIIRRIEYLPQTYKDMNSVKYRLETDYKKYHQDEMRTDQNKMLHNKYKVKVNPSFVK